MQSGLSIRFALLLFRKTPPVLSAGAAAALLLLAGCASEERPPAAPDPVPVSAPEDAAESRVDIAPELVPLPVMDWGSLPAAVRQRVRPIYESAEHAPDHPETVGRLAMALHAHKRANDAAVVYERARALAPNEFKWIYGASMAAEEAGRREEAAALLRAGLEWKADYAPGHVRLGDLHLANGDLEPAEQSYRQAIKMDAGLAPAHYGLGRLLLAKGEVEAAVSEYELACRFAPDSATSHYALGLAYRRLGRSNEAENSLARYEQLKNVPEPSFDPVADGIAEMAGVSGAPAAPTVDLPAASLEQVAAELEEALKTNPGLLSAHANLIAVYWELKQPHKAREHYEAALKVDPNDAVIHYNWGLMQALQGNLEAAAQSFRRAIEINPQYADAHVQYGVYFETQRAPRQAMDRYRRALSINPNHRRAHFHLGLLLAQDGSFDEGIRHLRETVTVDDRQTPAYLRVLAGAYGQSGDHGKALETLRRARERAATFGMKEFVAQVDSELQVLTEAADAQ